MDGRETPFLKVKWYLGDSEELRRIPVRTDLSTKSQGDPTKQRGWKIHECVGVGITNIISLLNREEQGWYYRWNNRLKYLGLRISVLGHKDGRITKWKFRWANPLDHFRKPQKMKRV